MAELRTAALYMRMSTERQDYSIEHQRSALVEYAAERNILVLREYCDAGKSGLDLKGRSGLLTLLDDVTSRQGRFDTVLVYDVSRWGRFQDVDESAYYEYLCRRHDVKVEYCCELFSGDESPMTVVMKTIKRAMAAEYSRELSNKVFRAQCRFVAAGFKSGGTAGYGLRRVLLSANGTVKGILAVGERKGLASDRVVLALGPVDEIATVRRIYRMYLHQRMSQTGIANQLNDESVPSETGRPWNMWTVKSILTNEKYVGNLIFNRRSFKLKRELVYNAPSEWIRRDSALPGIISVKQFERAQQERARRRRSWTDDEMIDALRCLYAKRGVVNARVIEDNGLPAARLYKERFGGLVAAYALAGVPQTRYAISGGAKHVIHAAYRSLFSAVLKSVSAAGATADVMRKKGTLVINRQVQVYVTAVRLRNVWGRVYWRFPASSQRGHFIVCAQLAADNCTVVAYYLLPTVQFDRPYITLQEASLCKLEPYRFSSIEAMFGLVENPAPTS